MAPKNVQSNEKAITTGAIEKLMATVPNKVFLPGSSEYASSIKSYFFKTARQSPACIFAPVSAEDVSVAVKLLAAFPEIKIAIRSGGHTPNPNHNNVESGVTFDLRGLNTLKQSEKRQDVVEVGGGCDWDVVYELLENSGKSAVGSREPSVGVGGFITGGGLSFFSPEHGFACDNVANFQVVLASGDIVNANGTDNSDLYCAIRGGQSNFGIVTRFDIITHKRPTFWGGGILYLYECEQDNLDAFIALKKGEYDPYAAVVQSFLYFGFQKAFCISNNMVYLQHVENPEGLKKFEEIQPQLKNTMRLDTTRSHGAELQQWQPIDQYALYVTTTIKITSTIGKKINDIWHAASLEVSDAENITSCLTYQQFPPQKKDNPNGMGISADAKLHKDRLIVIISVYWHQADQTDRFNKVFKEAMEKIEKAAKEENALHPYRYCNYASWWQEPPKTWGAKAIENLAETSHKYDPNSFFQKQIVGYKLA